MTGFYCSDKFFDAQQVANSPLIAGTYEDCVFSGCNFQEAILTSFVFVDCKFESCNLSMVRVDGSVFRDVTFNECKLVGTDFESCNSFGFSIVFTRSVLNYASMQGMDLRNCKFSDCTMNGVNLSRAQMTGLKLNGCDFESAIFNQTILESADLRSSTNYSIRPEKNRLKNARFSMPEVLGLLNHCPIIIE